MMLLPKTHMENNTSWLVPISVALMIVVWCSHTGIGTRLSLTLFPYTQDGVLIVRVQAAARRREQRGQSLGNAPRLTKSQGRRLGWGDQGVHLGEPRWRHC